MKLKRLGLLLIVVSGVATYRSAHLAGFDLSANESADFADFDLPPGYRAERILAPPLQGPLNIDISPSDAIVVTDAAALNVFQVHEDGRVTEYTAPMSSHHRGIAFDTSGNLYVADGGGVLWKVSPGGTATQLASGIHHLALDVGPSGDVFAVGPETTDVQRITPDGQVTVYVTGLSGASDVAVSPITGQVYVADWPAGAIYRANADGTVTLLSDGLICCSIDFSADGTLYHMSGSTGLSTVSTVDGIRTQLTWTDPSREEYCNMGPSDIAFDSQGRVATINPTWNHVVRYDLDTETVDVLYLGYGNSRALGVAPDGGGVFLGASHPLCSGHGRILQVNENGNPSVLVDDLPPIVNAIAFDAEGMGYVSAANDICTFTLEGITETLTTYPFGTFSLAIHPQTGVLWGAGGDGLWYLDDTGQPLTIPYPFQNTDQSLTFTPDGTLYFYANTSDANVAPVQQGIYRVDPTDSSFTRIADLSTVNMCCTIGAIGAGRDGNIYWVGYGDRYTPGNSPEMHMLRITPAGEVTLFGRDLPIDPAVVTGDPDSNDLYFGSAGGVYRVFEAIPTTLYVDGATGGDAGNNCQDPAAPCQTIAHAISQVWEGDTIRVAQGVHTETLTINMSVTLQGGYEAAGWMRNITLYETIIDGNQSGSVVTFQPNSNGAVLDGFTITGGEGEEAGGVHAGNASVTIRNCLIRDNFADGAPYYFAGGGVLGGLGGNQLTIINSRIINNQVNQGAGGVRVHDGTLVMINTLVADNHGDAGIHVNGSASMMNVTVANNDGGLGFNPPFSATLAITNSIFYSTGGTFDNCPDGQTCQISYSDFEGVVWPGTGNISADPWFVDPASGDYHLQPRSPCIDAGTLTGAPDHDLAQNPRPQDGDGDGTATTDMGAYEFRLYRIYLPLTLKNFGP